MLDCSIAERLRRLDIPQQVFATLLGITGGAVSSYLSQQTNPSASTEAKIKATLAELERLSGLFPCLPNFRSALRTMALLIAMRDGSLKPYEAIKAMATQGAHGCQESPLSQQVEPPQQVLRDMTERQTAGPPPSGPRHPGGKLPLVVTK